MTYKPDLMISVWNKDRDLWDRIEAMELPPFDKLPERRVAVHPTRGSDDEIAMDLWTVTDITTGAAYYLHGDDPEDAVSTVVDSVFSGRLTLAEIHEKFGRALKVTCGPAPEPTKFEAL